MLRQSITCAAAIGLAQAAAAKNLDDAYLRGSQGYDVSGPSYRVEQVAPSYPSSPPGPSYRVRKVVSLPAYLPSHLVGDGVLPISKDPIAPVPLTWSWTGFYIGAHVGIGGGTTIFDDPFGSSFFGDKVTTPGFVAGGQIGYNWQEPNSPWVFGLEANASSLTSDGTNTCLAYSGLFVSANCRARPDMMVDLTARVGWAYGHSNNSLLYAKGGAAFVHNRTDITTNATANFVGLAPQVVGSNFTNIGWTIGVGAEHAISPAWSVKLEYDYYGGLGAETVTTPPGLAQPAPPLPFYLLIPGATTRVTQDFQQVKLGVDYKFGMASLVPWSAASSALPIKAPVVAIASGWEADTGARYWYSTGRFQKDLGSTTDPALATTLNSRLTYDTTADSGEFFGRVETPLNIFVKGNIGAGSLSGGHMNDEDWVLFGGAIAYSNTLSDPVKGDIHYATVDLGYDVLRRGGYKLGGFVGYSYYQEDKSAYGCTQIANQLSDCAPAIDSSVLVITEDDTWKSFRIGANGEMMIADQFKLGADVAFLPYVKFSGTDNHVLRALISPASGTGQGVQLESILSYLVTDRLSIGVGGRYWAMWTTKNAITEFGGAPCPCQTLPAKTERYGAFLQVVYKFGGLPEWLQ